MSDEPNILSPEELAEQLNNKTHKESSVPDVLGSSGAELQPQTTEPVSCSTDESEVKDEQQTMLPPSSSSPEVAPLPSFDGFDIKDPFELLLLLDDNIAKGKAGGGIDLHPWQLQFLLDFAEGGTSDTKPFQAVVRACNGSGKDKYIIAPCVVWLCMRYRKARGVVTSSSGIQLDNQTDTYIRQLCEKANILFGGNVWKCNYRYYECLATGSPIVLFATDEAGKAEGYHPLEPNCKMGIFESEAKTVSDEINIALNKCTGYTHRCLVSTPGTVSGHFFDYCSTAIPRKSIKSVREVREIDWIEYHVTAFDCSHISKAYIEQMRRDLPGHEHGAAYKSQVMAEFGTTDEMVVIPSIYVRKCVNNQIVWKQEVHNRAGLDLSDGGDETALTIRNGNKHLATIAFRFDNTEDTIAHLNQLFKDWDLTHPDALIWSDMGGLGKPMLDRMKRQGWSNIRYVDNRNTPLRPKTYRNRGAELWFNLRLLFERGELIVIDEPILFRQLCTRYYKLVNGTVHQLLSKVEQKSMGIHSPDRADSFSLAFWDYQSDYTEAIITEAPYKMPEEPVKKTVEGDFDMRIWAKGKQSLYTPEHIEKEDMDELRDAIATVNKQRKLLTCK